MTFSFSEGAPLILGPEPEPIRRARERFDGLLPLLVGPDASCRVWTRQRRVLVRRESPVCWRVGWFGPDGFQLIEGLVLVNWLYGKGFTSIFVYADALSDMLDIFQPVPKGEPDDRPSSDDPGSG